MSSPKDAQRPARGKLVADQLPLRLLYWIYERRLLYQIDRRRVPRHVGIILDGNRRHARDKGVNDPLKIYRPGAEKLDEILDWCAELSIPAVTLWVFSTENFKRSPSEVSGILAAIEAKVATLAQIRFSTSNGFVCRPSEDWMFYLNQLPLRFEPRKKLLRNTTR